MPRSHSVLCLLQCSTSPNDPLSTTYANLIANPGFDGGIPSGWQCIDGCTLSPSSDGSYAIAADLTAASQGPGWDLSGQFSAGAFYNFQIWARVPSGKQNLQMSLLTLVGDETSSATLGQSMVMSGCWTKMLGSYTALGNETKVILSVGGAEAGGDIWVAFAAAFDPPAAVLPKLASFAASATAGLVRYGRRSKCGFHTKGLIFCFCGLVPFERIEEATLGSLVRETMERSRLFSCKPLEIVACFLVLPSLIGMSTLNRLESDFPCCIWEVVEPHLESGI
jgi:hypothetical protein